MAIFFAYLGCGIPYTIIIAITLFIFHVVVVIIVVARNHSETRGKYVARTLGVLYPLVLVVSFFAAFVVIIYLRIKFEGIGIKGP